MPFATIVLAAAMAAPAPTGARPPTEISAFSACRAIADAGQRLACYDSATQKLEQAISTKELTVLSRTDVSRSLTELTRCIPAAGPNPTGNHQPACHSGRTG